MCVCVWWGLPCSWCPAGDDGQSEVQFGGSGQLWEVKEEWHSECLASWGTDFRTSRALPVAVASVHTVPSSHPKDSGLNSQPFTY